MASRAYILLEICFSTAVVYCASLSGCRAVNSGWTYSSSVCIVELEKQVQQLCSKAVGLQEKDWGRGKINLNFLQLCK